MFDELLGLLCGDLPIEMFGTRFGTKLDARGGTLTRAATLAQSTIRTQRNEIDRLRAALQKSETLAERQGRANAAALERIKEIAEAPRLPPVVPARLVGLRTEIQRSRTAFEAVAELGYAYRREIAVSNSIASHNATLIFSLAGIGVGEGGEGEAGIEIERPGKALYTDEHRNRVEVLGPGEHDRAVIRTVILSIEREHDDEDSARVAEIPIDAFLRIMEQGITTRSQDP